MKQLPTKKTAKQFLLIDDDPAFCALLERRSKKHGIVLHYYTSLDEFGHMRQPVKYDVVILDFDLGEITGPDAAAYVSGLFGDIPVVLVSASAERDIQPYLRPGLIRDFVQKVRGCDEIIRVSVGLCAGKGTGLDKSSSAAITHNP